MTRLLTILVFLGSVLLTRAQTSISEAEYFFNTDPGLGQGFPLTGFIQAGNIDINELIDVSALTPGIHTLGVRIKDENELWSIPEFIPVFVSLTSATLISNITEAEYFFGSDPGQGAATALSFSAGQNPEISQLISTDGLSLGMHTLSIRLRNEFDAWSLVESVPVFVDHKNEIRQIEYFYDTDPGHGTASNIAVNPSTTSLDTDEELNTTGLAVGLHTLGVRLAGSSDVWGITEFIPINICDGAIAAFSTPTTCIGDATPFTDLSANTQPGDTYSWDFDSNMIEDDNTIGGTSFTYAGTGTFTASLTVDRIGCSSTTTNTIEVIEQASATAGEDQSVCRNDVVNLSGSLGGSASAATWSTFGDGLFDDTNSLNTFYTPGEGDLLNESVILTLTTDDPAGTCTAQSDNLTITFKELAVAISGDDQTICETETAGLSGSLEGVFTANWTTAGDGSFDNPNSLNAIYTPGPDDIRVGNVLLTLTPDDTEGCGSLVADDLILTINSQPQLIAGSDTSICPGELVELAGSVIGSETEVLWTSTGSGIFADPNVLTTTYTPSEEDESSGNLEFTLTAINNSVCSILPGSFNITIAQPIELTGQSISVLVGDTAVYNLTDGSFGSGEKPITTIVQPPSKGTATLLDDGSIIYIPQSGNLGEDRIEVRVCNQCNNCEEAVMMADILNSKPAINVPDQFVPPRSKLIINLDDFIADANDNIDYSTLAIISAPTTGAPAMIDGGNRLNINYSKIFKTGSDQLTIEVCDDVGECVSSLINIQISETDIVVINALSPNNDGIHDFLRIENIRFFPDNLVTIYNRWGDRVYEARSYDNVTTIFEGLNNVSGGGELRDGTYFYVINKNNGSPTKTGFLEIRR